MITEDVHFCICTEINNVADKFVLDKNGFFFSFVRAIRNCIYCFPCHIFSMSEGFSYLQNIYIWKDSHWPGVRWTAEIGGGKSPGPTSTLSEKSRWAKHPQGVGNGAHYLASASSPTPLATSVRRISISIISISSNNTWKISHLYKDLPIIVSLCVK